MNQHERCDPHKAQVIADLCGKVVLEVQRRAEQDGLCPSCVAFSLCTYGVIWFHGTAGRMPIAQFVAQFVGSLQSALEAVDARRQAQGMTKLERACALLERALGRNRDDEPPAAA